MKRLIPILMTVCAIAGPVTPPSARALRLLNEGKRELAAMRSTDYAHQTEVDESKGRFDFDCSGFLCYALKQVDPAAYDALPVSKSERPLAQDFFSCFDGHPAGPWKAVQYPEHLKPGDIVSWLKAPEKKSRNTGHVMLVRAHAYRNPDRADEILVPILDSTEDPHADDSRTKGQPGLGQGTIGIIVDRDGRALRYRWRGGLSKEEVETRFAFGRLE